MLWAVRESVSVSAAAGASKLRRDRSGPRAERQKSFYIGRLKGAHGESEPGRAIAANRAAEVASGPTLRAPAAAENSDAPGGARVSRPRRRRAFRTWWRSRPVSIAGSGPHRHLQARVTRPEGGREPAAGGRKCRVALAGQTRRRPGATAEPSFRGSGNGEAQDARKARDGKTTRRRFSPPQRPGNRP